MNRITRHGIAVLVCSLVACGSDDKSGFKGTVKIAIDLPEGGEASASDPITNGVKLAVKQAASKVGDYDIQVVFFDDSLNGVHDPATGAANMATIAADPAFIAVIGPLNSAVALEEIPVTNAAGLFQCSPANTNPSLTKPELGAGDLHPSGTINYVRVATTDDVQGPAAATYMYKKLGVKKVYILDDTGLYGIGIADAFETQFNVEGGTVLAHYSADIATADYAALMLAAAALNPDGIYFGGITASGAPETLQAALQAGLDVPFMAGDGIFDGPGDVQDSFLNLTGAAAKKAYSTLAAIGEYPQEATFNAAYLAEYGSDSSGYAPEGYACAQVVLDALARAGATSPADLAALRADVRVAGVDTTHTYNTILGSLNFDANGDTSQKIVSIYDVDVTAAGGAGDWVYKEQVDFGATP